MRLWARTLSTLALVMAGAVTLSPWQMASAQSGRMGVTTSGTLYQTVEPALVEDVLQDLGFETTVESIGERGSREFIILAELDGFVFLVNLRSCDVSDAPRGCLGLDFFTTWKVRRGALDDAEEAADIYNSDQPFGKVTVNRDSTAVYFSHYLITDGGISRENIASNAMLFVGASAILVTDYLDGMLDVEDGGGRGGKS